MKVFQWFPSDERVFIAPLDSFEIQVERELHIELEDYTNIAALEIWRGKI